MTLWGCDKRAGRVQKWGSIEVIRVSLLLRCSIHVTLKRPSGHLTIRVYIPVLARTTLFGGQKSAREQGNARFLGAVLL